MHVFERDGRFATVAAACCTDDAVALLSSNQPDVVLLDIAMPDSFAAAEVIGRIAPRASLVALGVPHETDDVVRCAEAGIAAYVPRDASLEELLEAVDHARRGELRCSPKVAAGLLRRVAARAAQQEVPSLTLTAREREIVRLIDDGLSNKDIARRLGIEVATVKNHVHNALKKLRVRRRAEAAVRLRKSLGGQHPDRHLHQPPSSPI